MPPLCHRFFVASLLIALLLVGGAIAPAWAAEEPSAPTSAATGPIRTGSWLFMPRGNPWLAGTLSLGFNGVGQFYNGENEKGWGMLAGSLAFPIALGVDSLVGVSYGRVFALTAMTGIKVWSVVDAFSVALPPKPKPEPIPNPGL